MLSVLMSSYLFINIIESICETQWQDGDGFRLTYVGVAVFHKQPLALLP